jgi:hypothetical protein
MSTQPLPVEKPNAARALAPPVVVREVGGRWEMREFLRFPWEIYAQDKAWVPPLLAERRLFVNRARHPFFRHGQAAFLIARRGQRIVGRVCVSDDPRYNAHHGVNQGCAGLFECHDDEEAAHALFDAAAAWLRQRGRDTLVGPIDYSTNYTCGLLVDGFDTPPRVMMNHHPRYYQALWESWGFRKAKDLFSWWFDDSINMLSAWKEKAVRLEARSGTTIRPFRLNDFAGDVQRCLNVYNEAWQKNWGAVPMTDAESLHLARTLRQLADPNLLLIAEANGKPVGFCLTLPDFNEAMRPLNGRLFPFGWLQFKRNLKRIRTGRVLTCGVVEKYRRRGIADLMILRTLLYGKYSLGFNAAELGWTLEDNSMINRTIQTVGGERYKTYRIYERSI